jgi:hypothetical protein
MMFGVRSCSPPVMKILQQAEVGAGLGFGQAHGAGPLARHDRAEERLLLPVVAVVLERLDGAVREQRVVGPAEVGAVEKFLHRGAQRLRHVLSAQRFRRGQPRPAAGDELVVGSLEAGRRRDVAGGLVVLAADLVADVVERGEHGLGEARGLLEHGVHHVALRIADAQAGELGLRADHVEQRGADRGQRRLVGGGHGAVLSASRRAGPARARASSRR